MMYACGDIYSGEWVNSQCCGNGIYVYKSGDVYKGQFVQDKFNGYGILTWVDGSSYEGEFRDDTPQVQEYTAESMELSKVGTFIWVSMLATTLT